MPIEEVLDELDRFALRWAYVYNADSGFQERRDKHRRAFRTDCEFWYYGYNGTSIRHYTGLTRNLSERGIGLITKSVVYVGTPIEVCVRALNHPPVHFGGIVTFCRYASKGFHEIGVVLKAYQNKPIFSNDHTHAPARFEWLQEALLKLAMNGSAGQYLEPPRE